MDKAESRRVVHIQCIGKCEGIQRNPTCKLECVSAGFQDGQCAPPDEHDCCCATFGDELGP